MASESSGAGNKGAVNAVSNTGYQRCITGKTKVLGVIAHPVGHSLSPPMHNSALESLGLDYVYVAFDVLPENVGRAVESVRALGMVGINVTIPHKEAVIPFLDEVSPEARAIGSVNTIVNDGGILRGESTDGRGFIRPLESVGVRLEGEKVVVLGAGGSAKAVVYALVKRGACVTVLNRTEERARELAATINDLTCSNAVESRRLDRENLAEALDRAGLMVNTTSVGMHPNEGALPCPADLLRPGLMVYDIIYNPLETELIRAAKRAGARTLSGVKMLVHQGAVAFEMWTGVEPPLEIMEQSLLQRLRK